MSEWNNWLKQNRQKKGEELINYFVSNKVMYTKLLNYQSMPINGVGSGRGVHEKALSLLGFETIFTDKEKDIVKEFRKKNPGIVSMPFDILSGKLFGDRVIITDGLLEHFNKPDLVKALHNMKDCRVQFHCVPIQGAKVKNFGNEIYRSHEEMLTLFKGVNIGSNIEVIPISHTNKFLHLFRRMFDLSKYGVLPFEKDLAGTNLYIINKRNDLADNDAGAYVEDL